MSVGHVAIRWPDPTRGDHAGSTVARQSRAANAAFSARHGVFAGKSIAKCPPATHVRNEIHWIEIHQSALPMGKKQRFFVLVAILVCVTLIGTGVALTALYQVSLWGTQKGMVDFVTAQARAFETVAERRGADPGAHGDDVRDMRDAADALWSKLNLDDGRWLVLARPKDEQIEFLSTRGGAGTASFEPIPLESPAAEPFRRAFSGETGALVGVSINGTHSSIGFTPLAGNGLALASVIEIKYLRLALVVAATLSGAAALIAILFGAYLFHRINGQIISDLETQVDARTRDLERELDDREKRENALRESEEKFRRAFEDAETGVLLTDPDGIILRANRALCKMLGYNAFELIGKRPFVDLTHPDDVAASLEARKNVAERRTDSVHAEKRYRHKNGGTVWVSVNYSFIRDAGGRHVLTVGHVMDVTARKRAEEEKAALEAELRQTQKLEAIGQLAAGIAHEINTPIQYIGDNLRFVEQSFPAISRLIAAYRKLANAARDSREFKGQFDGIEAILSDSEIEYLLNEIPNSMNQSIGGVEQVSRIVRAMREFSHPGQRGKAPADVNRAIENTVTVSRNEWKESAEVELELDPDLSAVDCVVGELNQVFLNLIVNAAQAVATAGRGPDGRIRVSTQQEGQWAIIRIADNGTGIPDDIRERIFEPFFTTKEVGKGTGQGLSVAHDIVVNKHGGTIDVESGMGEGACFVIRIPIHGAAAGSVAA
jgi:PAS domain S-box-containing protein